MAAGGATEPFWGLYAVHFAPRVMELMEQYRIGKFFHKCLIFIITIYLRQGSISRLNSFKKRNNYQKSFSEADSVSQTQVKLEKKIKTSIYALFSFMLPN